MAVCSYWPLQIQATSYFVQAAFKVAFQVYSYRAQEIQGFKD